MHFQLSGLCPGLLLCVSLCMLSSTCGMQVNESPQSILYNQLIGNNIKVRPVKQWTDAVDVYMTFMLVQITDLDCVEQTLSVVGALHMFWMDPFMTWNASANGIDRILVPATEVWVPEFAIYNSANGIFRDKKWLDYDAVIYPTGTVSWNPSGLLKVSCNIAIALFPFDHQQCSIIISNWMEKANGGIHLTNASAKVMLDTYMTNSEWDLMSTAMRGHVIQLMEHHIVSQVHVSFVLRRRYIGYITLIVLPLLCITFLSILVFPLPPESGEKVSLGVTIFLSFSLFQLLISENLPKSSEVTPFIMIYVMSLMVLNGLSITMTVLVLHYHHKDPAPRLPNWTRAIIFGCIGRITCTLRNKNGVKLIGIKPNKTWDNREKELKLKDMEAKVQKFETHVVRDDVMTDALVELRKITGKMEADLEEEDIKFEWRRAAGILDQFLFMCSIIIVFGSTIGYFVTVINLRGY